MIRTLAITVLWGLTASAGAALAAPDPTALGGSIDKAVPKKANDKDPALVVSGSHQIDHLSPELRRISGSVTGHQTPQNQLQGCPPNRVNSSDSVALMAE